MTAPGSMASSVLPVDAALPELMAALAANSRAVLVAPPGSGKTTRVPLALKALGGTVLVLEPRRLAARSAARFMAGQLGEAVGDTVGYRVRLDSKVSARTRVELLTEGILTRRLLADPELTGVSCVVFDEFHERSLQADLGLALCLEVQRALRPDLRLLVMSATLDVEPLRALLDDCPLVRADGRMWPVDIRYAPPAASLFTNTHVDPVPGVVEAVRLALREEQGSLLVFLPGAGEIRRTVDRLAALPPALLTGVALHPLYGDLPPAEQDAAIAPAPPGTRKVVLATSIAETSLTIEGVRVVIDSGLARSSRFDPATGMNSMVTGRVSQAGADQRAGRAGRVEPGVCLRLWAKGEVLPPHFRPEMLEADLAPLLLDMLAWGAQPEELPWLTPPPAAALEHAGQTLLGLGAAVRDPYDKLRGETPRGGKLRVTPHGEKISRFPLHPRLAHMLLCAGERAPLAAVLAALISERDPLRSARAGADIRLRFPFLRDKGRLFQAAGQIYALHSRFVSPPSVEGGRGSHSSRRDRGGGPITGGVFFDQADMGAWNDAGRLISLAWPERIAQRRSRGSFRLASGRGAMLPEDDPLAGEEFLAVAALDTGSGGAAGADGRIFLAAPLSLADVEEWHGNRITREDAVTWDSRTEAVQACRRVRLDALVLEEKPLTLVSPGPELDQAVKRAVTEGIRSLGLACLPWTDEWRQWQARVLLMRRLDGTGGAGGADTAAENEWPDVSDAALLAGLMLRNEPGETGKAKDSEGLHGADTPENWLAPWLDGVTRRSRFGSINLGAALCALLPYGLARRLENEAPTHMVVPSGSSVAIDYLPEGGPVLAVKLQEMFGQTSTPAVARGRCPLTVHLLSPAGRPLQVTRDLAGFWRTGYAAVRAEVRGRYPKHPWPEDPLAAIPTRKVKNKM